METVAIRILHAHGPIHEPIDSQPQVLNHYGGGTTSIDGGFVPRRCSGADRESSPDLIWHNALDQAERILADVERHFTVRGRRRPPLESSDSLAIWASTPTTARIAQGNALRHRRVSPPRRGRPRSGVRGARSLPRPPTGEHEDARGEEAVSRMVGRRPPHPHRPWISPSSSAIPSSCSGRTHSATNRERPTRGTAGSPTSSSTSWNGRLGRPEQLLTATELEHTQCRHGRHSGRQADTPHRGSLAGLRRRDGINSGEAGVRPRTTC